MTGKIDLVLSQLRNGFPGQSITYQSNSGFDDYRIENNGLLHCLCISKEFLNDNENNIILNLKNAMYHIVDVFKIAKSPMRLLITTDGVKEVTEEYCDKDPSGSR